VEFATGLLARGIEFVLRQNGRLHVWPAKAYPYLTDAERDFIREHRAELKALATSKALPETTVVWYPPTDAVTDPAPAAPSPPVAPAPAPLPAPVAPPCVYCGQSPCIGPDHHAYSVLHANDPREIKRLDEAATAVMFKMTGVGSWL
ncbi:MAG: hypothetical protein ABI665_13975, partial [Vicinamibacterales bacterium]